LCCFAVYSTPLTAEACLRYFGETAGRNVQCTAVVSVSASLIIYIVWYAASGGFQQSTELRTVHDKHTRKYEKPLPGLSGNKIADQEDIQAIQDRFPAGLFQTNLVSGPGLFAFNTFHISDLTKQRWQGRCQNVFASLSMLPKQ